MQGEQFKDLAIEMKQFFSEPEGREMGQIHKQALLAHLVMYCLKRNPMFDHKTWLNFVYGNAGPRGGKLPY